MGKSVLIPTENAKKRNYKFPIVARHRISDAILFFSDSDLAVVIVGGTLQDGDSEVEYELGEHVDRKNILNESHFEILESISIKFLSYE